MLIDLALVYVRRTASALMVDLKRVADVAGEEVGTLN